ncbi:MAG TPA: hypothetical protein EYP67_04260, partial [Methanosarcinales archaeon]|nr:hypothetical protein [Methanosarcinales archaeon]
MDGVCCITDNTNIAPGDSHTYTFGAIPILVYLAHSNPPKPSIGHIVRIWYEGEDGTEHFTESKNKVLHTTGNVPIATAYENALKEADYLIITDPYRLFSLPDSANVDDLLSEMAQLAVYKEGVLGYAYTQSELEIQKLIRPGGDWAKKLNPKFSKPLEGYLLIVGETEIVPAWNLPSVHFSDQPYSDTSGNDDRPELAVGRIIGNSPTNLSNAIQTCIGCKFDRSHALTVAGDGGGTDSWAKDANQTADILDDEFSVEKILWKDYPSYAKMLQRFRAMAIGRDVIMYSDHAGPDEWCDVIYTSDFPVNFGNTNPFVFAFCCLSGRYENHTTYNGGDYNIAEAFFDSGAAVYIGSTENSQSGPDNRALNKFYKGWVKTSKSIGAAFVETERDLVAKSNDHYWAREYNLYGDPKVGASASDSTAKALGQMVLAEEAPSSLEIVVPNYAVTTINELDYVEIPDGMSLLVEGKPEVPFYSVYIEYPEGSEIQDVLL